MNPLYLLIDGDMLAFRSASASEVEINWGNDIFTLHSDLNHAKAYFCDLADEVMEKALNIHKHTGDYLPIFCFSSSPYFRTKILSTYKMNRKNKRKPVAYKALVEWVKKESISVEQEGLEADDCIGILATSPLCRGNSIIISGDKDMKCISGFHYDYLREEYSVVTEEDAYRNFLMQTLMGDTTDGYSGCPKIGKVTASKLLDADCSWKTVKKAFEKAGLSEEEALRQARCAKILLYDDYEDGKVRLWKPQFVMQN